MGATAWEKLTNRQKDDGPIDPTHLGLKHWLSRLWKKWTTTPPPPPAATPDQQSPAATPEPEADQPMAEAEAEAVAVADDDRPMAQDGAEAAAADDDDQPMAQDGADQPMAAAAQPPPPAEAEAAAAQPDWSAMPEAADMSDGLCNMLACWAVHHHLAVLHVLHKLMVPGTQPPTEHSPADALRRKLADMLDQGEHLRAKIVAFNKSCATQQHSAMLSVVAPEEGEDLRTYLKRVNITARYGRWPRLGLPIKIVDKMASYVEFCRKHPDDRNLFKGSGVPLVGVYGMQPKLGTWFHECASGTRQWPRHAVVEFRWAVRMDHAQRNHAVLMMRARVHSHTPMPHHAGGYACILRRAKRGLLNATCTSKTIACTTGWCCSSTIPKTCDGAHRLAGLMPHPLQTRHSRRHRRKTSWKAPRKHGRQARRLWLGQISQSSWKSATPCAKYTWKTWRTNSGSKSCVRERPFAVASSSFPLAPS